LELANADGDTIRGVRFRFGQHALHSNKFAGSARGCLLYDLLIVPDRGTLDDLHARCAA
jgi:hypothetical protein